MSAVVIHHRLDLVLEDLRLVGADDFGSLLSTLEHNSHIGPS